MLTSLKVRWKIAAVLFVPLILVATLGWLRVSDRREEADRLAGGRELVELAVTMPPVIDSLERQAMLSERLAHGGDDDHGGDGGSEPGHNEGEEHVEGDEHPILSIDDLRDQLSDEGALKLQHADTAEALADLDASLASLDLSTYSDTYRDTWEKVRSDLAKVDSGDHESDDHGNAYETLPAVVDGLVDLNRQMFFEVDDPDIERLAFTYYALSSMMAHERRIERLVDNPLHTGTLTPEDHAMLTEFAQKASAASQLLKDAAPPDLSARHADVLGADNASEADALLDDLLSGGPGPISVSEPAWHAAIGTRLDGLRALDSDLTETIIDMADSRAADARNDANQQLLLALAAIVTAGAIGALVSLTISRPLRELAVSATRVAEQQLPALIERMEDPTATEEGFELEHVSRESSDEIGRVAVAFGAVEDAAVMVAKEQSTLLRKGVDELFVNLARRNQSAVNQAVEYVQEVEADPGRDRSDYLPRIRRKTYALRRNIDNILVLAGSDVGTPAREMTTVEIVKEALAWMEQPDRVDLVVRDEVIVVGDVSGDVVRILAELIDNAIQFSSPEYRIKLHGESDGDSFVLRIRDQGIGMTDEQIRSANERLSRHAVIGLKLGNALGFRVIGRLAPRHDISVQLSRATNGGLIAEVRLPPAVIVLVEED